MKTIIPFNEKIEILDEISNNQEIDISYFTDEYEDALIGYTVNGDVSVAVYDYTKCIESRMEKYSETYEEAVDWFMCNTVRTVPYMGKASPIFIEKF